MTDACLVSYIIFNGIFFKKYYVTELVKWLKLSLLWGELTAGSAYPRQILLSARGMQSKALAKVHSVMQLCSKERRTQSLTKDKLRCTGRD